MITCSLQTCLAHIDSPVWQILIHRTQYGLKHNQYGPDDPKFWDFSFEEMASYDLPAIINFIVENTSKPINYVGHSQGK